MAISLGTQIANNSAAAATVLYAGDLAVASGDLLIATVTWSTTDATPTFSDDQGHTWTKLTKRQHGTANRWVQVAYAYNCTANSADSMFVDMGTAVVEWSFAVSRWTGAKTTATPYVDEDYGTANATTSVTAGDVDPGADGMVWSFAANDDGYLTGTAGSGHTKIGSDADYGFAQYKLVSGAGNVAAGASFSGSSNLVIVSAAFISAAGTANQRIRVVSSGSGMQSATGIGGYVWNSDGTSRLATFSGLTAQASLDGNGDSVLFISANGLGLSNGATVLVALANSTYGGVYLATGTVEAGSA